MPPDAQGGGKVVGGQERSPDHLAPAFQENAVDGPALMELTHDELMSELKCTILQARKIKGRLPAIEGVPPIP